ncbi:LytR/AlgR family response regulator transcription factor [Dyadobacter pollutisoli]|uniref:LytTR family DNA-binding domain-containing protein n=1 Tax=Dyadobacter pollutisoli TaxID=2910158 RepID=A0A9E8NDW5_9BACT|nr:LytTR family DNA-binding domain-containing protein [Dyadobacter pollutisoli]WAC14950.1 LytTR family DNA-binding domain-containing protein [Dyadobacter pollutisoli]
MTYSSVLIDDEIHCTESLQLLLEVASPQIKVVAKFNDGAAALEYLRKHRVDLVFLDIEMPEISGFEILNRLEQLLFDVIFVTAYDQYAIKAFTYSAISYLLKPVDADDLKETLHRWQQKKNKVLAQDQLGLMHDLMTSITKPKTKVALPTSDGLEFLEIQYIVRCESESNYTRLFCKDKSKHLICRTLKEVEKVLHENGFIRVHHSHLVNPRFIKKFLRHDGGFIVMEDGTQISVSRTKKDRLFDLFNNVERL